MYAYVNHSEFCSSRRRFVVFASGLSGGMQWLSNATLVSHSSLSFKTIPLYIINHTDSFFRFQRKCRRSVSTRLILTACYLSTVWPWLHRIAGSCCFCLLRTSRKSSAASRRSLWWINLVLADNLDLKALPCSWLPFPMVAVVRPTQLPPNRILLHGK